MATRPSLGDTTLALELDGKAAGPLRSVLPAGYRINHPAADAKGARALRDAAVVSLSAMAAEAALPEPGPLLDWLTALLDNKLLTHSGAVLVLDRNGIERRRLEFRDAGLTGVTWSTLSATDGKRPFGADLAWQPAAVDERVGSGKQAPPVAGKRKQLLCSNFRVLGLPFDGQWTTEVALPSVGLADGAFDPRRRSKATTSLALGELKLQVAARSTDTVMAWVRKLVDDGRVDPGEDLSLQVELLDATLKKVMARFQLTGCALRACDEARLIASAESPGGITLRFAVQQLGLQVNG